MKIIYNKIIPFKGFIAINLLGIMFARKGKTIDTITINHESIHTAQMREMLYVGFYIWYIFEWLIRLFMPGNAYKNISFEREAYDHENDCYYLENRKRFSWFIYYKQNCK